MKKIFDMARAVWNRTKIEWMENLYKKDPGESHVITVIAMCVIGIALVLLLSTALKPVITSMCGAMEEKIISMFNGL
ncbi:MAG TPA: hypothetical protein IAA08_07040 [Candidatus Eubacterium avistercoris]|uniref:Uncharacterized protein n=1 Tax=Candidatus Eubacterium avistercoris TaxID=2838567 RepID=A0A9D2D2Z6_9FIRM|nr:hypothetical protein [Candidatus Eubacterium avistercoris]